MQSISKATKKETEAKALAAALDKIVFYFHKIDHNEAFRGQPE